jgi:microcystin-dependent protein
MPRTSGIYTLPVGNPVTTGTTITSNWANTTLTDIATTLTNSLATDGQTSMTGNLPMGNYKITGMADGTTATDAATVGQVTAVSAVLTGVIQMWATTSAPAGYLLCAGSAVSRTTYAALFAVIGTTFGAGDGSTTFNLPNYADRMPIGISSIAATIGATGGSKDAITVAHTHTASLSGTANTSTAQTGVYDAGHAHNLELSNYLAGATSGSGTGQFTPAALQTAVANASLVDPGHYHSLSVTTSGTTASTGSSGTNANLPPYLGINFIIKT